MKQKRNASLQRALCMLLSIAMLLSFVVMPVGAETTTDTQSESTEQTSGDTTSTAAAPYEKLELSLENVNFYEDNETVMIHGNWISYLAEQNVGNQTLKHFMNDEASEYSFTGREVNSLLPDLTTVKYTPYTDHNNDSNERGIYAAINASDGFIDLYNIIDDGNSNWPSIYMDKNVGVNVSSDSYVYLKFSSTASFNAELTFSDGTNSYVVKLSEVAGLTTTDFPATNGAVREFFLNLRPYIKNSDGTLSVDELTLTKITYYVVGGYDSWVKLHDMFLTSSSVTNLYLKDYKALVVEYMGTAKKTQSVAAGAEYVSSAEGAEYVLDAVLDCSVDFDESPHQLKAKTDYGFVLYIPSAVWDNLTTKPDRGDLIDASFIYSYGLGETVKNGLNNAGQTLTFYENPTEEITYAEPVDVNATVKLFNYDESITKDGYNFWNGHWGWGGNAESVDGAGVEAGTHEYPVMLDTLDANGYPQISNGTSPLSLGYLFNGNTNRADGSSTLVANMTNGGGLFQMDNNGYYYYDSMQNAAYYDATANDGNGGFVLYEDLIVRPWYHAFSGDDYGGNWPNFAPAAGAATAFGNFLPFNKVTTENITVDGAVYNQDYKVASSNNAAGSLEAFGLTSIAANKVLPGTKAMNTDAYDVITKANGGDVTSARLEDKVDMGFGMTVDFDFYMSPDGLVNGDAMEFDFLGDDDVFVYLGIWTGEKYEYKLVLDIGGIHGAKKGNINFATGDVIDCPSSEESQNKDNYQRTDRTLRSIFGENYAEYFDGDTFADYTKLSLKFFYLERGGNISYCRLRFNIPLIPDDSLTISKSMDQNVLGKHDYSFRVLKAIENEDSTYTVTEESFIPVGTKYTIVGSEKTGAVEEGGWITVSAGQAVRFDNIVSSGQGTHYVIEEKIPESILTQYNAAPSVTLNGETVTVTGENGVYRTAVITANTNAVTRADNNQFVAFTNSVSNLGTLKITKLLADGVDESLSTKAYRMQVTIDGALLPVGTKYTVTGGTSTEATTCTVTEKGVVELMVGQTVQINNILSDSLYTVTELDTMTGGFAPSYEAVVESTGDDTTKFVTTKNVYGTFGVGGIVHVTVTNSDNTTGLVVDKTVEEVAGSDKDFILTLEAFATGDTSQVVSTKPADIVLVVDQSASMYTPAGYTTDRRYADKDHADNVAIPDSAKVSDFVAKVQNNDPTILENAKHQGYYIAVHNTLDYMYVVKYAEYKDGDTTKWGWFYVPIDVTTRPVTFDTANSTSDGAEALFTGNAHLNGDSPIYYDSEGNLWSNLRVNDFGTYAQATKALLTNCTYYKTQYGELYDAIKKFVADLNSTGIDHSVAIVGFSSPFYDALDYYNGSGLYINGQYFLYDTDYKYKATQTADGTLVRDDVNGTVVLDPDVGFSEDDFVVQAADASETNFTPIGNNYSSALVSTKNALSSINASIEAIKTNYMQTCPAVGIRMARSIFRGTNIPIGNYATSALDTTSRDKIIVLFTDGVPTVSLETDYDNAVSKNAETKYEYWHPLAGAASTINEATLAKQEGITIYTIGTGAAHSLSLREDQASGDTNIPFLEVVSSNYYSPSASFDVTIGTDTKGDPDNTVVGSSTYTVNSGTKVANSDYAKFTGSSTSLEVAFGNIFSSVSAPNVSLNGVDVLQEVLSQYFNITDKSKIKVYTAAYNGEGDFSDDSSFAQRQELTTAHITVLKSDSTSDREDVIQVRGYDYHAEYLRKAADDPNATYYGSKLILEVPITVRDGFWGGNNVPTNGEDTSIFDVPTDQAPPTDPDTPFNPPVYSDDDDNEGNDDKGTEVIDFPLPEVNVPVDVEIVVKDKVTYYGNDVDASELIESVTAGGLPVTVNPDNTFTPQAEWMDDYADLQWSDNSTKPSDDVDTTKPDDYTFSVELTPKYDGTPNPDPSYSNMAGDVVPPQGDTASDTAEVDILVPVITFNDSLKDAGTSPNCETENREEKTLNWVYIDNNAVSGTASEGETAPTLTYEYHISDTVAENVTLTDDVAVNVTVNSTNDTEDGTIDMQDAAIFQWDTCDESPVSDFHTADQPHIERHPAAEDSPEFYIHVPTIRPDTVVIDFGLPVNINVLANDDLGTGKNVVGIWYGQRSAGDTLVTDELSSIYVASSNGRYGVIELLNDSDDNVKYVLNTSNGMQVNTTEVFTYAAQRGEGGKYYYSTVTVIPATTIYYEDNFLSYNVYQYTVGEDEISNITDKEGYEDLQWKPTADTDNADQAQDRPGKLDSNDAGNIYGFDGAYSTMSTYSLGSAMKFIARENDEGLRTYGTASFTFTGTGFDIISMTTDDSGTITVEVTDTTDSSKVYNYIVDTYYGYEYVQKDGKYIWQPSTGTNQGGNTLYQVPVIKADGLPYGTYDVVITISYADFFDHGQYNDASMYDFYLDAIRIYDPANDGAGNQVIEDAYVADGEGWPAYQELRNLIITANDFNSLEGTDASSVSGIVFIDNTAAGDSYVPNISDYTNYGPNNELYLAPGQAIAFNMNMPDNTAAIHLAMKSVGGSDRSAKVSCFAPNSDNEVSLTVSSATDLYYDITSLNNGTVIIKNAADSTAILSITNIKVTYKENPADADIPEGITVGIDISEVLNALNESEQDSFDDSTSGAITLAGATLSFESEIMVNLYYTAQNLNVDSANMGLLLWDSNPTDPSYDTAQQVISGALYNAETGKYMAHTNGIAAKNLGDDIYMCVYAKTADDTYVYSDVITYSPKAYAMSRLQKSDNEKLKKLCVAMLNYGAAAQEYFSYKTEALMNADLTDEMISAYSTGYSSALVADVVAADSAKVGSFGLENTGFAKRSASVSFDDSFSINFYFTPNQTVTGDVTFYCWSEDAYNTADTLSADNCSGTVTMTEAAGSYWATYSGIAPKDIDDTIYVCGTYTVDGVVYSTGVIAYSLGTYCVNRAADDASTMQTLAQTTAVYGYCAKTYFDAEVS